MPQMMPINWIFSLVLFILLFIIFNMMNYFIFNNKYSSNNINKTCPPKKNFSWKW